MTATPSSRSVPSPAETDARQAPTTLSASAGQPEPGTSSAPSAQTDPAVRVVDGVWSASRTLEPEAPRRFQPGTFTWGVLLAAVGAITMAIGLGARVNLATAGIGVLATLGVLLLVLALLPQRSRSASRRD